MKKDDIILKGETFKVVHRDNKFVAFCTYKNTTEKFFSVRKYARIFSPNGEKKKKVSRSFLLEDGDLIVEISLKRDQETDHDFGMYRLNRGGRTFYLPTNSPEQSWSLVGVTIRTWSSSKVNSIETIFEGLYQVYDRFDGPTTPPELIYPKDMDPFFKDIINKTL